MNLLSLLEAGGWVHILGLGEPSPRLLLTAAPLAFHIAPPSHCMRGHLTLLAFCVIRAFLPPARKRPHSSCSWVHCPEGIICCLEVDNLSISAYQAYSETELQVPGTDVGT